MTAYSTPHRWFLIERTRPSNIMRPRRAIDAIRTGVKRRQKDPSATAEPPAGRLRAPGAASTIDGSPPAGRARSFVRVHQLVEARHTGVLGVLGDFADRGHHLWILLRLLERRHALPAHVVDNLLAVYTTQQLHRYETGYLLDRPYLPERVDDFLLVLGFHRHDVHAVDLAVSWAVRHISSILRGDCRAGPRSGADRREDSVPEPGPRVERGVDGLLALAPLVVVVAAQVGEHGHGHGRVRVAVDLDVPFEVVDEDAEAVAGVLVDRHHLVEHVRDEVLPAERERRGLAVHGSVLDEAPGGLDELDRRLGGAHLLERGQHRFAVAQELHHGLDRPGVGAGLLHRPQVQLEVADEPGAVLVALLDQDDVVDQPAAGGRPGRHPRDVDAGQLALQGLQEGHEVPDGEDVVLHERDDRAEVAEARVHRMSDHPAPRLLHRLFQPLDAGMLLVPVITGHLPSSLVCSHAGAAPRTVLTRASASLGGSAPRHAT